MAICTVAEAKRQLNKSALDTSDDAELQIYIDAITELIESQVGPVTTRTITQDFWPETTGHSLVLTTYPVLAVTSIVDVISGFDMTAWFSIDTSSGVIHLKYPGYMAVINAVSHLQVTYTAGRAICPPTIKMATLLAVGDMWESQRGHSSTRPLPGAESIAPSAMGMLSPRVREMLNAYRETPAFA